MIYCTKLEVWKGPGGSDGTGNCRKLAEKLETKREGKSDGVQYNTVYKDKIVWMKAPIKPKIGHVP